MKKTIKRTLAIVMAVAMLFALSVVAFAAQPDQQQSNITVYVTIQEADIPTGNSWNYTLSTVYVTDTYATDVPVSVPVGSTVKDVVEAMAYLTPCVTIVNSCSCGNCGTHTSYGCTCSSTSCTCTWKQVQNYYDPDTYGNYASVMNSLCYDGITNTNNYTSTGNSQHGSYTGTSWEYFTFVANENPQYVYPNNLYMNQYVVSNGEYIVLSFDTSSFTW